MGGKEIGADLLGSEKEGQAGGDGCHDAGARWLACGSRVIPSQLWMKCEMNSERRDEVEKEETKRNEYVRKSHKEPAEKALGAISDHDVASIVETQSL